MLPQGRRDLQSQAGLARAAEPDEGDDPPRRRLRAGSLQPPGSEGSQFAVAADKAGEVGRQTRLAVTLRRSVHRHLPNSNDRHASRTLPAFALEVGTIGKRASAFAAVAAPQLRDMLGAALLTKGDYSSDVGWNGGRRQLDSSAKDDSWRDLFTTGSRASTARTPALTIRSEASIIGLTSW